MAADRVEVLKGVVEDALPHIKVIDAELATRGGANENWLASTTVGGLVVKISRGITNVDKLTSASRATDLARRVGAPIPAELAVIPHCDRLEGRFVRIIERAPGRHLEEVDANGSVLRHFFTSLGDCVARLHSAVCSGFGSRVEAEPRFSTWASYVRWRLPQIEERARAANAFTDRQLRQLTVEATTLAEQLSPQIQPVVTHRDLHLGNILLDDDGTVTAILDMDGAEPWDATVDFVKLTADTFPRYPGASEAFYAGYTQRAGALPEALHERLRLVEMLEVSNFIANGMQGSEPGGPLRNRLDEALNAASGLDAVQP